MTHDEIVAEANKREWHLRDFKGNVVGRGKLAGSKLSFPRVYLEDLGLSCEISWHLAERLATGDAKFVSL